MIGAVIGAALGALIWTLLFIAPASAHGIGVTLSMVTPAVAVVLISLPRTRAIATGLLIAIAAGVIVAFGVCVNIFNSWQ